MLSPWPKYTRLLYAILICFLLPVCGVLAQQQSPTPQSQSDDVVRINTDLVQTDVMVFDKSGRFVDGLKPEQFELSVDGKSQPISLFDRVVAGSASEEAQLAAARGTSRPVEEKNQASVGLPDRGRTVIFFIDDLHLAADSLRRTQKTLLHFINDEMGQNDQAAIASTSGQVGFLQQLTDNKTVLRVAVQRLKLQPQSILDGQQPPMSEYLALAISARGDQDVLNYFMEPLIKEGMTPQAAETLVKSRAQQIGEQAHAVTRNTFLSLESLANTISRTPGRKLVFFISDGFMLNTNETDIFEKLGRLTNAAARNSVVIYTMDARGLSVDSTFDASTQVAVDPSGRLSRAVMGEISASQEALRTLAADTGGRALLNTNALDASISRTLKETSIYYIIAWRPEIAQQKNEKLRQIEVKIKDHPDLTVQVKRGFLVPIKEQTAKAATPIEAKNSKAKTLGDELRNAISSFYPSGELPMTLALTYLDSPQLGVVLSITMQVPAGSLSFDSSGGKFKSVLDVEGHVYNDQGKAGSSFQEILNVTADSLEAAGKHESDVYYNSKVHLAPGLYQVRVAARDAKSGRIGSATQWIEIPDLKSRQLALSSLFIGEVKATDAASPAKNTTDSILGDRPNVTHRFPQTSRLRFLTFIYNATPAASGSPSPDVAIQVQVLRDGQPVLTTALRRVATEGLKDLARIPYALEIPLEGMRPGRYLLQVSIIDRVAKTSASQLTSFEIE
jgi:VWFA-related protein